MMVALGASAERVRAMTSDIVAAWGQLKKTKISEIGCLTFEAAPSKALTTAVRIESAVLRADAAVGSRGDDTLRTDCYQDNFAASKIGPSTHVR